LGGGGGGTYLVLVLCCEVVLADVVFCGSLLTLLGDLLLNQGRKFNFVSLLNFGYLLEGGIDDLDIVLVIILVLVCSGDVSQSTGSKVLEVP